MLTRTARPLRSKTQHPRAWEAAGTRKQSSRNPLLRTDHPPSTFDLRVALTKLRQKSKMHKGLSPKSEGAKAPRQLKHLD